MRILDTLFGAHTDRLHRALGRTTERHRLLVGNLANINTPGYKRRDADFAVSLREAETSLQSTQSRKSHPGHFDLEEIQPRAGFREGPIIERRSIRNDGNSVDLEREVAALTETQLHYSALTMIARRYFQGMKNVIREGK